MSNPVDPNEIPRAEDIGAWMLGALEDDEAATFAQELNRSEALRDEVARLQPVVDALPMGVEQMAAPEAIRERLMATVRSEAQLQRAAAGEPEPARATTSSPRRERRRLPFGLRPWTAVGLASAALLMVGVAGGALVAGGGGGSSSATTVQAKVMFPGSRGTLVDRGAEGGRLTLTNLPAPSRGHEYQVWLLRKGGKPQPTDALFSPNGGGHSTVNVPGDLRKVDQVLVTEEPAGGSKAPTRSPIVIANV